MAQSAASFVPGLVRPRLRPSTAHDLVSAAVPFSDLWWHAMHPKTECLEQLEPAGAASGTSRESAGTGDGCRIQREGDDMSDLMREWTTDERQHDAGTRTRGDVSWVSGLVRRVVLSAIAVLSVLANSPAFAIDVAYTRWG